MVVVINPIGEFDVTIDVSSDEWKSLSPSQLRHVHIAEHRRPCRRYPDGVFPGCRLIDENLQEGKVVVFSNYVEYAKVMPDEVSTHNGKIHLNATHYKRREQGWKSIHFVPKNGHVIAHCINGKLYSTRSDEAALLIYQVTYLALIQSMPEIERLREIVDEGYRVHLIGEAHPVLEAIAAAVK